MFDKNAISVLPWQERSCIPTAGAALVIFVLLGKTQGLVEQGKR